MQEANKQQLAEYGQISDMTRHLNGVTSSALPTFSNLSLSTPLGKASLSSTPESLGIGFEWDAPQIAIPNTDLKFNPSVSTGLTASNGPNSQTTRTFIELFKKVQVGVGWETTWMPNGTVQSGPTFDVGKVALPDPNDKSLTSGSPTTEHKKPDLPLPIP